MRNGYIIDTPVDIQEIVEIGGKLKELYERVFYEENFKTSLLWKKTEKLFSKRQKCKDESNELMHKLDKLIMNSLRWVQTRKDSNEFYKFKSQHWMETEYDENVLGYWRLPNGYYFVKMKKKTD